MDSTFTPTENDLQALRDQIQEAKRAAEFEQLKQDLHDITYKAVNTPNEFEGMMQVPDTQKILKTKRKHHQFVELLLERIRGMFALRPVIGNIIALMLSVLIFYYIFHEVGGKWFEQYGQYFTIGIQFFAGLQIIKSGTRSLILPFLALIIGGMVSHGLSGDQTVFHFGKSFYEHLTIVGIIGLGVSILAID